MTKQPVTNWGKYPLISSELHEPDSVETIRQLVDNARGNIIARGNGRCYGDASLADEMISTLKLNNILDFDVQSGIINCQSGVILSTLLEYVIPHGFFVPVTPGTRLVSIGGMLASDVHGKNHHVSGVFSKHVLSFELMTADQGIVTVNRDEELFYQTAGGMGLTGIILSVRFQLKRIETTFIRQKNLKAENLQHIFELFEEYGATPYSVAWIDCLTKGNNLGRSVLNVGDFAKAEEVDVSDKLQIHKKNNLNIPFNFPGFTLNKLSVKAFNAFYYNNPLRKDNEYFINHYEPFFYPLDKVLNWNRIYGKKGFVQYQFVIPKEGGHEAITSMINEMSRRGEGSFLAVLKLFGKDEDHRYLRFPMEGYTLAVDFKVSRKVFDMLNEFDSIVNDHGGRLYLTKDARMQAKTFDQQYPDKPKRTKFFSHQAERLRYNIPVESKLDQSKKSVLVIGANSDVAKASIEAYIKKDYVIMAASRKVNDLEAFRKEQQLNDMQFQSFEFDAEKYAGHQEFYDKLPLKPHIVLYAAGFMSENEDAIKSWDDMSRMINVNYSGAVSILNIIANDKGNQNLERIVGISSLAGVRARKSNFLYGSAKAAFSQYLYGLRQLLSDRGVIVNAVAPGFIKTKMTAHLPLNEGLALSAEEVAKTIVGAGKKFLIVPGVKWKIIYRMVMMLPEKMLAKI